MLCFCVVSDSAWKSSSGCKIETTKCRGIGGGCRFCWLCWIAARGAPNVILVTNFKFYNVTLIPLLFFVSSVVFYSLFVVLPLVILVFSLTQLKRLKLRKNNWDSDTYEFDEVLTEFASQKRVYEVVAKPVVEVCCFWCLIILEWLPYLKLFLFW